MNGDNVDEVDEYVDLMVGVALILFIILMLLMPIPKPLILMTEIKLV